MPVATPAVCRCCGDPITETNAAFAGCRSEGLMEKTEMTINFAQKRLIRALQVFFALWIFVGFNLFELTMNAWVEGVSGSRTEWLLNRWAAPLELLLAPLEALYRWLMDVA